MSIRNIYDVWEKLILTYLRIDGGHGLSIQQGWHASSIVITDTSNKNGIQPIQMPAEVPETGFTAETTIDEEIEAIDAE